MIAVPVDAAKPAAGKIEVHHNDTIVLRDKNLLFAKESIKGIRTCFLPKKVSKIPSVKNIIAPLIQAQHVVLVSGAVSLCQDKNQDQKNKKEMFRPVRAME